MNQQLTIPFGQGPLVASKKTERITITSSYEFKSLFEKIASISGISASEFGHACLLEGMQRHLGTLFTAEPQMGKTLAELLGKS